MLVRRWGFSEPDFAIKRHLKIQPAADRQLQKWRKGKMTKKSASNGESKQHEIPWEERLEDHNNKKTEYLENCLFRGCNPETTIKSLDSALTSIFKRVQIEDPTYPAGRRQLLCWDLLDPKLGATYISLISTSLLQDELAPGTRRYYMRNLRLFCEFIVAKPNISGPTVATANEK